MRRSVRIRSTTTLLDANLMGISAAGSSPHLEHCAHGDEGNETGCFEAAIAGTRMPPASRGVRGPPHHALRHQARSSGAVVDELVVVHLEPAQPVPLHAQGIVHGGSDIDPVATNPKGSAQAPSMTVAAAPASGYLHRRHRSCRADSSRSSGGPPTRATPTADRTVATMNARLRSMRVTMVAPRIEDEVGQSSDTSAWRGLTGRGLPVTAASQMPRSRALRSPGESGGGDRWRPSGLELQPQRWPTQSHDDDIRVPFGFPHIRTTPRLTPA